MAELPEVADVDLLAQVALAGAIAAVAGQDHDRDALVEQAATEAHPALAVAETAVTGHTRHAASQPRLWAACEGDSRRLDREPPARTARPVRSGKQRPWRSAAAGLVA